MGGLTVYTEINFKTKKALKEAIANGKTVYAYQEGPFASSAPRNGWVSLEGPHYPEPHRWYARALLVDGQVTKVK